MQFSAGVLAGVASKTGGDRIRDGRYLAANANHQLARRQATTYQQEHGRDLTSRNDFHQQITTIILDKLKVIQEAVECDPLTEILAEDGRLKNHGNDMDEPSDHSTNYEREFGILSSACGVGRKCHDGLCVDVEGSNLQDQLRLRSLQSNMEIDNSGPPPSGSDGLFNTEGDDSSILGSMQLVCDVGAFVGYDCSCNFDAENWTGNASCILPEKCSTQTSACGVEVTDCSQEVYGIVLKGTPGVWDAELCKQFLNPYAQEVCYETSFVNFGETIDPECKLSIDGEQCSTCNVYSNGAKKCYNFDCGNTALAGNGRGTMSGNTCRFPANTARLYLDTYGCPPCDLCGEKTMTSPVNEMPLFGNTYECAYVQDVALKGFFTSETCENFASVAQEPCGCAVLSGNETGNGFYYGDTETGPVCNICPNGISSPDTMLSMSADDEFPCSEIVTAGLAGSIDSEELCQIVQERASGPCCGAPIDSSSNEEDVAVDTEVDATEFCSLCGDGKIHTNDMDTLVSVPTKGIYSCGELFELGKNGTLAKKGICLLVQLSANTPCQCVADGPTVSPTIVNVGESYEVPNDIPNDTPTDDPTSVATSTRTSLIVALAAVVVSCLSW